MKIIVLRHGLAEDKLKFAKTGKPDALRPLTQEGVKKMKKVARGLFETEPEIKIIASSPFARALQTAEIAAKPYGLKVTRVPELAANQTPDAVLPWLAKNSRRGAVALVGHEPYLGRLVSLLIFDQPRSVIDLRKGGACMIEFNGPVKAGQGTLVWLLKPSQLKRLGT